jgi:hypothetical protein
MLQKVTNSATQIRIRMQISDKDSVAESEEIYFETKNSSQLLTNI